MKHEIKDTSQRPDVHFYCLLFMSKHFLCIIFQGSTNTIPQKFLAMSCTPSEICYFHSVIFAQQNVLWLQISMNIIHTVEILNCLTYFSKYSNHFFLRTRLIDYQIIKIFVGTIFHYDVVISLSLK